MPIYFPVQALRRGHPRPRAASGVRRDRLRENPAAGDENGSPAGSGVRQEVRNSSRKIFAFLEEKNYFLE